MITLPPPQMLQPPQSPPTYVQPVQYRQVQAQPMGRPMISMQRGRAYEFALPAGWSVGEEGHMALVLHAPDASAVILNIGNTGLIGNMRADQFTADRLRTYLPRAQNFQVIWSQQLPAIGGYDSIGIFEVRYIGMTPQGPQQMQGIVLGAVSNVYRLHSGFITIASAREEIWPSVAPWMVPAALAAVNLHPNAYNRMTTQSEINQLAEAEGRASAAYRAWSQNLWAQVAAQRAQVWERQRQEFGEVITGKRWEKSPYGGPDRQESTTPAVIWESQDGRRVSSGDPNFDPRTVQDPYWRRVR